MTLQTNEGTHVPEDSFAIIISGDGAIETVVPTMDADAPLTNGHILIIGLARKLQDPEWTKALIEDTGDILKKAHAMAKAMEETEQV